jgi:hypothetical protein
MRAIQYPPLARRLQERALGLLCQQLRPPDFSRTCTAWQLLAALVLAACVKVSLAAAAALRPGGPSRETLRQARRATLPDYDGLRRRLPGLLAATLPRGLRRRPGRRRYPLAIDLHRVPYYKRGRTPPPRVRKGQRLAGTRYAHDYATASLLCKGRYYVVAVEPFAPGETLADVVKRLLRGAARLGFSPRYVLLDRSFFTADVVRYLQRARYPFVLAVPARGKRPDAPGGPTGTWRLLDRRRGGWDRHRLGGGPAVPVAVHVRRRPDRRGRRVWAYAVWGVSWARVRGVVEAYRRRFRIEASYRLLEEGRARTSSRDEGLRLWYVALAAVLVNLWLALRREAARGRSERAYYLRVLVALAARLLAEAGAGRGGAPPAAARTRPGP